MTVRLTLRRVALALALCSAPRVDAAVTEIHYVMGTYLNITVDDADSNALRASMRRCFTAAQSLDARFSRFQKDSELSRVNANRDPGPVEVSEHMAALLHAALALKSKTGATFDVSAGALTQLWRTASTWPTDDALAHARATAAAEALRVEGGFLYRRPGTVIDVDGVAKGWAVDRCVAQLRSDGVRRAFISFGESSLYALGAPRGKTGWSMALRSLEDGRASGELVLRDEALSVSAVFGHERNIGGRRVGHIVDPRSGLPLTAPAIVAVSASSATTAEAYSKALLIDPTSAVSALRDGSIRGAVLIDSGRTRRMGGIDFRAFTSARAISAAAEPLR